MTAQAPDRLESKYEHIDFGELALYAIVQGDVSLNHGWGVRFTFEAKPIFPEDCGISSGLWHGYISEFSIDRNGRLTLDSFLFPTAPGKPRQLVGEKVEGDFWLVMKSDFFGDRVYIPFKDGGVIADESKWIVEGDSTLEGLRRPKRQEPPNPHFKIPLPQPVHIFTVDHVRDDEFGLGWKYIGSYSARGTCSGSRVELRYPDGNSRVVRFGGSRSGKSIIVSSPCPVPDIPIGTEVWLLETEKMDYARLAFNDPSPLPIFGPAGEPVDFELRRNVRKVVDAQLKTTQQSLERDTLSKGRREYPACLADGSWVVYDLPTGHRILYIHNTTSYVIESLESDRLEFSDLSTLLEYTKVSLIC